MKQKTVIAAVALIAIATVAVCSTTPVSSTPTKSIIVKLYSGGVLVGEWEAYEPGRIEAGQYVFRVKEGSRDGEVRINGTWSVEAMR